MNALFTKFDPRAFLECNGSMAATAKAANAAKATDTAIMTLATLAGLADSSPRPQATIAHAPELIAPLFERIPPGEGEPSFEMACAARRGLVEERGGIFVHFCAECGAWGAFGYGVGLRVGRLGAWDCAEHRPEEAAPRRTNGRPGRSR